MILELFLRYIAAWMLTFIDFPIRPYIFVISWVARIVGIFFFISPLSFFFLKKWRICWQNVFGFCPSFENGVFSFFSAIL